MGRGNTGPVYPWFGKDIRDGIEPGDRELPPAAPAVAGGRGRLAGQVPYAAGVVHRHSAAAGRCAAVRSARPDPQSGDRRAGGLLRRRILRQPHLLADLSLPAADQSLSPSLRALRARPRRPGHRRTRRAGRSSVRRARTRGGSSGRTSTTRSRLRARAAAGGVHPRRPRSR